MLRSTAFTLLLFLVPVTTSLRAEEYYVAHWNLENLFDTADDPAVEGDEEFTPGAAKRWTDDRFQKKVSNLVRVIQKMNDDRGPDVLGVCEIENRTVLERLARALGSKTRDWKIVHKESPSARGIDCAILYDARRLTLKSSAFHGVNAGNTRDVVEARLAVGNDSFYVFENHWPSQGSPESARIKAASVLRQRLDKIFATEPDADCVILGDLNDHVGDPAVRETLKATDTPAGLKGGRLYNTMWPIVRDGHQGTYVFDNKWEVIDHVIVSPGLLNPNGFQWRTDSTKPVQFSFQMFNPSNRRLISRPSRSYSGDTFHNDGCSDHLPVGCVLIHRTRQPISR